MNTQEQVKIVIKDSIQPNQMILILLVALASLGLGLVPLVYGLGGSKTEVTVPTEAGLWHVLGEKNQ
ncbi:MULTISPECIES: hypothetical protein [unclassified Coleofasciculus]|uniref:hypothetical protein n=1 Tax=unclassified Coleofasciculus TaxID=2692782 RepID=UPI00187E28DA|nr:MULTISPECIES: hypothetical protein [unclassified Coleofasciculus]MBE9125301.1 hypothetical protein [Coleofasciculus sp. LEGE 07081]MBE9147082.1 hypothetical protein [Coleofasciculus sp. LEGE 07092]